MNPEIEWWRWTLIALLFGGLGAVWLWLNRNKLNPKQWLAASSEPRIKVVERRWLSPKLTVYLIEIDGERHLLSQTSGHSAWQKIGTASSPDVSKDNFEKKVNTKSKTQ